MDIANTLEKIMSRNGYIADLVFSSDDGGYYVDIANTQCQTVHITNVHKTADAAWGEAYQWILNAVSLG